MTAAKTELEGRTEEESVSENESDKDTEPTLSEDTKQRKFIQMVMDCGYSEALATRACHNASSEDIENEEVAEGLLLCKFLWVLWWSEKSIAELDEQ